MSTLAMLQVGGIVAAAAAIDTEPIRLLQAAGRPLASGVLEGLEAVTDHYARTCWSYQPDELDRILTAQLAEVRALLEGQATASQKARLCRVAARLACMVAHARWNLGRGGDASLYYDAAFELAEQAGDRTVMAEVFAEEATVAYYERRDADAVAAAGRHAAGDAGAVLVKLTSHEARAAARLGNRPAAAAAITTTRRVVDAGDLTVNDDLFSFTPAAALHRIAAAELWLGNLAAAKAMALAAAAACASVRDRAANAPHANLTLAAVEIRLGNVDAAVGMATEVLTSELTDARSVFMRGRDLLADLSGHAKEPLVASYRDLLHSVSRQALPGIATTG